MKKDTTYIFGKNAVAEALQRVPESIDGMWLADYVQDPQLIAYARAGNVRVHPLDGKKIEKWIGKDMVHQGIVASVDTASLTKPYKEFMDSLEVTPHTSIAILAELHDPQNVGAVIRSAAAFGVTAVFIPLHNQAPVNGTVVKVSAGAAFAINLVSIGNVNQAISDLKEKGFWIYGLDSESKQPLTKEKFEEPSVFVIGNEGEGLREKTREHCDILLSIPMSDKVESLNAASSAAITFYDWSTKHRGAL